jgi:8-oxo-dGTP pyrophosphatase MutT (NUDIX family)
MKEVCRAIITDGKGRVLLGKRARGTAAGQYALIGGKPDSGENPRETVIREVREELGVDFAPTLYLEKIDSSSDPADPWMVYYFVGPINGDTVLNPDEVEDVIFVSEDDLDDIEIAFDGKERLREYFQSLK